MEESSMKKLRQDSPPATAASLLTDDLILEVLSHLPARSVRRFKCVSTTWRDLIADPAHRKKLPQTLAGFLYNKYKPGGALSGHFASVSGGAFPVDPSLHFLQPNKFRYIALEDTCNGLLLCACYNKETPDSDKDEYRYVMCNPATERWIELPPPPQALANRFYSTTRLAFDPAVSSHFHVLQFWGTILSVENYARGVDIFSSQTGAWIHRDSELLEKIILFRWTRSVFFGGMLHLVGRLNTINVDKESALMVLVQGCLYYAGTTQTHISKKNTVQATKITLWCLENHDSKDKEWVLKHSASIDEPLGTTREQRRVFAIHPDCDTVFFFVSFGGDSLASYDIQHQKFVHILNLEKGNYQRYLPYVPLFSEVLAVANGQ
ncbi:hypothetical protein ACQ4PT_028243 [Festuca glaucescens]